MKTLKLFLASLSVVGLPAVTHAQTYLTDLSTTVNSTGGGLADRLFLDSGSTTLAPVGSRLWIVADTDANGLPSFGPSVQPDQVLGPGDQVIFQDVVDGTLLGSQAGRYNRLGITADNANANLNLYAILWGNGTPTDEAGVQAGNTFGVFNLGVKAPPPVGNAQWYISGNINGSEFTVVPEPSPLLLGIGGFCVLLAVDRFRRARG